MSTSRTPVVGFIGLGRMGSAMAGNLAASEFGLVVWNRTSAKAVEFAADKKAQVASRPVDVAREADILITMVSDGDALKEIYTGPDGVAGGLASSKMAVDMSTVGPEVIHGMAPIIEGAGSGFVDAPVSGSVAAAESASLMIMAGGEASAVESVRPVLEVIGKPVLHVGALGSGASLKLAINHIIYGINQAVSEALVLAERTGVDRSTAFRAFVQSAAAAPVVKYRQPIFEEPSAHPVTMSLDLAIKDLELILECAADVGVPMPQAEQNLAFMREASSAGFGESDMASTAQYLRGDIP